MMFVTAKEETTLSSLIPVKNTMKQVYISFFVIKVKTLGQPNLRKDCMDDLS